MICSSLASYVHAHPWSAARCAPIFPSMSCSAPIRPLPVRSTPTLVQALPVLRPTGKRSSQRLDPIRSLVDAVLSCVVQTTSDCGNTTTKTTMEEWYSAGNSN